MGEFNIPKFLILILLFSMMITGFSIVYGNLGSNYNIKVDTSFNSTYDKIQNVENISVGIGETIQEENPGALDVFFLAGKSIIAIPKIIFSGLAIVASIFSTEGGILETLGIPPVFSLIIVSIITIMVVFAALSIYARYKAV